MNHFAASFEDDSFVHAQAWCEDFASKNRRAMNFHPVFGADASIDFAADDHDARIDLPGDPRALSYDERIGCMNFASKDSSDPNRPLKAKLAFELTSVVDDARDGFMSDRNTEIVGRTGHRLRFFIVSRIRSSSRREA